MEKFTLEVVDSEVLKLIEAYDSSEKRQIATLKALKIGLIALKDMEHAGNVDYVEKEFDKFKISLNKEVSEIKDEFVKKLETADKQIEERFANHFSPENGLMGRILDKYLGDGGSLSELFNENKNDSAVSKIKNILSEYLDEDASKISRLLDCNNEKSPLHDLKKEITERLIAIQGEIKATESAKQASRAIAQKSTQKGAEYEDLIFPELENIASILGDTCIPTGDAQGLNLNDKRGDFVVKINKTQTGGADLRIVFETKDKEMYLNSLIEEMSSAMKNRAAGIAVGVISNTNILKDVKSAIGNMRDYIDKIVCVFDKDTLDGTALEVSYKLARSKLLLGLKAKEMKSDSVDIAKANILIDEIGKKLGSFTIIKSNLTKASNAINESQTQIDGLKIELLEKVDELHAVVKLPEEKINA